jgi:hypothetical protein
VADGRGAGEREGMADSTLGRNVVTPIRAPLRAFEQVLLVEFRTTRPAL